MVSNQNCIYDGKQEIEDEKYKISNFSNISINLCDSSQICLLSISTS